MSRYLILFLLLIILVSLSYFTFKFLFKESTPVQEKKQLDTVEKDTKDLFIGDYFSEEFEETRDNKATPGKDRKGFQTCELFGQEVKEGTAIFDSTCTVSR